MEMDLSGGWGMVNSLAVSSTVIGWNPFTKFWENVWKMGVAYNPLPSRLPQLPFWPSSSHIFITCCAGDKCDEPKSQVYGMFFKLSYPSKQQSFAFLPYIKGVIEPLTQILKRHNIQVFNKPTQTMQQDFPVLTELWPPKDNQYSVIYKIPCASCQWSYIGETKRSFQ